MKEDKAISFSSTWKSRKVPRGKYHNKTATKTTVSIYISKTLIQHAREKRLNLSQIMENALESIINYLPNPSSKFLSSGSFLKESEVPRARFEPATTRSSASPSPIYDESGALPG
jgi:hypothetical protein